MDQFSLGPQSLNDLQPLKVCGSICRPLDAARQSGADRRLAAARCFISFAALLPVATRWFIAKDALPEVQCGRVPLEEAPSLDPECSVETGDDPQIMI